MGAYGIFKYLHSGLRFVVLLLVLLAIVQALAGWLGNKPYTDGNRKINLFAMISAHTQLIIGIVLYFLSPFVKSFNHATMTNTEDRYWTLEHWAMMVFAIALITVGHARSKRIQLPQGKHRAIAIFYLLAVVVIIVAINQGHRPMFGISS